MMNVRRLKITVTENLYVLWDRWEQHIDHILRTSAKRRRALLGCDLVLFVCVTQHVWKQPLSVKFASAKTPVRAQESPSVH